MKKLLLLPLGAAFGLLSLGLPGCGTKATSEAATPAVQARALENTLLARHDSLMGQTEQLFELKAQLTAAKVPADAPVLAKMQTASQAMMTWMHAYQPPDSTGPAPQRLSYLQDQQTQLLAVQQQITAALDSGKATLRRATLPTAPAAALKPK
jgi:hypothetical protein